VADALPESFAFVVDEVADGGDTVGVQWHVEADGEPLPFTRGCSVCAAASDYERLDARRERHREAASPRRASIRYTANADGLLLTGFDVPEPAPIKPGGAGLALLSLASKIIKEPLRAAPLLCFLVYCQQLFLAEGQLLPGPSALALDGATWVEVRDLSLAARGQWGLASTRVEETPSKRVPQVAELLVCRAGGIRVGVPRRAPGARGDI